MLQIYTLSNVSLNRNHISKSTNMRSQYNQTLSKELFSHDYIPTEASWNSKPPKITQNGPLGHSLNSNYHHQKLVSITHYSHKADKVSHKLTTPSHLSTHSNANRTIQPKINNKQQLTSKSLPSKEDQFDFMYKKMFLYSLRMHKFKERFHFDNLSNITNNRLKKALKPNDDSISQKISSVNQKLGFMKGVIDYCYPSQFLLKMKESKLLLNKNHQKALSCQYTSEGNLCSYQTRKKKRFKLLKNSIHIQPLGL